MWQVTRDPYSSGRQAALISHEDLLLLLRQRKHSLHSQRNTWLLSHISSRYKNTRPTKVLFLEIMLSGNGAELSDRVLERLGQLSRHHNFSIVVDEILTGGRCGTMLLTQQAPGSFQERVTHITMGKWLQAGLVLSSEAFKVSSDETLIHYPSRGPSTEINATPLYLCWELVDEMLEYTDQHVLSNQSLEWYIRKRLLGQRSDNLCAGQAH